MEYICEALQSIHVMSKNDKPQQLSKISTTITEAQDRAAALTDGVPQDPDSLVKVFGSQSLTSVKSATKTIPSPIRAFPNVINGEPTTPTDGLPLARGDLGGAIRGRHRAYRASTFPSPASRKKINATDDVED